MIYCRIINVQVTAAELYLIYLEIRLQYLICQESVRKNMAICDTFYVTIFLFLWRTPLASQSNVEKNDPQPPYFINLLSVLKVEIDFDSIGFGNIVAPARTGKDLCTVLFLLTILFYMCIPCFGLL